MLKATKNPPKNDIFKLIFESMFSINLDKMSTKKDETSVVEAEELAKEEQTTAQKQAKDNRWIRIIYAYGIFGLVFIYIFCVLALVTHFVCHYYPKEEHLNSVMITLLSTTTVNVIGLLAAIVLNLFPKAPS